jgi:hypothetical protein
VSRFYKIALLLLCPILILIGKGPVRLILVGVVGYLCLRTFFLVSLTAVETRYLSPMFPVMELALLSVIGELANRIRPPLSPSPVTEGISRPSFNREREVNS